MDDLISRQAAINALGERPLTWTGSDYELGALNQWEHDVEAIKAMPTIESERGKWIPRDAIEYILRKETVNTNPYNFAANEKFIQFMDDPEIASFGRWQHANGFNTALVAVKCGLDKIPNAEPQRMRGKWMHKPNIYGVDYCSECDYELHIDDTNYCPNCGADMRGGHDE